MRVLFVFLWFFLNSPTARGDPAGLVIFAPELTQQLLQTRRGKSLAKSLRFLRRPARLRHDEHYHVDFAVSCATLAP